MKIIDPPALWVGTIILVIVGLIGIATYPNLNFANMVIGAGTISGLVILKAAF